MSVFTLSFPALLSGYDPSRVFRTDEERLIAKEQAQAAAESNATLPSGVWPTKRGRRPRDAALEAEVNETFAELTAPKLEGT